MILTACEEGEVFCEACSPEMTNVQTISHLVSCKGRHQVYLLLNQPAINMTPINFIHLLTMNLQPMSMWARSMFPSAIYAIRISLTWEIVDNAETD